MKEIPTEHLVICEVPLNLSGTKTKTIQVNTLQLLNISWHKGQRTGDRSVFRRRANSLWCKKHPLLSKIYVPMKFWISDYDYNYWYAPKVILSFGESSFALRMCSNDAAEKLCGILKANFFTDISK